MKIEHVAMYVDNLENTKQFFETYFGAMAGAQYHNAKTGFRSYFLSFDDGARLEIMNKPNITPNRVSPEAMGYIHLAFCVGSREAVDCLTQRLKDAGYAVVSGPRTTGDGYYESCIVGVEGNLIEITV